MSKDERVSSKDGLPWCDRPIDEIAQKLQETLGPRLTAHAMGGNPQHIGAIASGEAEVDERTEPVLRNLAQATEVVSGAGFLEMTRDIMIITNPMC